MANARTLSEEDKKLVEELHLRVFKETLPNCNCSNKWADAVVKLSLWYRQHPDYIVCGYAMQRGVVFILDGVAYTSANLTDEIAERLLSENEQAKKFIKKLEGAKKPAPAKKKAPAPVKTVNKEEA